MTNSILISILPIKITIYYSKLKESLTKQFHKCMAYYFIGF